MLKAAVDADGLVIVAAGGSIFYQYRLGRRAPSEPARIPYIKWTKTFGDAQSIETQHVSIFACRHPC